MRRVSGSVGFGSALAAAIGYLLGGFDAAVVSFVGFLLGVCVVWALLVVVTVVGGTPSSTSPWPILPLSFGLFVLVVFSELTLPFGAVLSFEHLAASFLVTGLALGRVRDVQCGLWDGIVVGGTAGICFVYVAIYSSYTAQPELWLVVLISGVVAPLAGSTLVGTGGFLGGLAR
ncbi:hypothetical protein [Haladaptatus sp. NG-SE-30]